MVPMMKRPPTLLPHHGLFDHSRGAACEGGGEQRSCSTDRPSEGQPRQGQAAPEPESAAARKLSFRHLNLTEFRSLPNMKASALAPPKSFWFSPNDFAPPFVAYHGRAVVGAEVFAMVLSLAIFLLGSIGSLRERRRRVHPQNSGVSG
jgi:hypothetical protein